MVYTAFVFGRAAYEQNRGADEFLRQASSSTVSARQLDEGTLIGRLEIPRLKVSAIVFEGTADQTLGKGVGHYRRSSLPESSGNVVLAAHRDTFFRPLARIRNGDVIILATPKKELRYVVTETRVVDPTDLQVVQPTSTSVLTLITCYPFSYLGSAPQRFIVRAKADPS